MTLVPIFTKFATGWDDLPRLVAGRDDYRVLVVRGVLLGAISVIGQLAPDGVIELVDLELDTTWPEDDDEVDGAGTDRANPMTPPEGLADPPPRAGQASRPGRDKKRDKNLR